MNFFNLILVLLITTGVLGCGLGLGLGLSLSLSDQPYVRKEQVKGNPLFQCPEGTSLITRSGTIGRMAYARSEMAHMAISQDVLKVVPNTKKVQSGYLYAFLSSPFGIPQITGGTFGSIIVHIEAENIAELPIPRLPRETELRIHNLVVDAASRRTMASQLLVKTIRSFEEKLGLPKLEDSSAPMPFCVKTVSASNLMPRFDAFYHSDYHLKAVKALTNLSSGIIKVSEFSKSVVEPPRLKRPRVEDRLFGVPFFGTSALMQSEPEMSYLIAKNHKSTPEFIVHRSSVLIPRSGQLSGIIGTAVLPFGLLVGGAISEDAIRINCKNETDAGYIFIALSSPYGLRQLKARAYSSSIPHLDVNQIGKVIVPNLQPKQIEEVGGKGCQVAHLREQAIDLEHKARKELEMAIKEAA